MQPEELKKMISGGATFTPGQPGAGSAAAAGSRPAGH